MFFYSFRSTNNNGCYRFADKTVMPVFCKYMKNEIKILKKDLVARFLLMTALVDLLIVDSALLLYFSESRTRSRNSTMLPIFQNLS